MQSRLLRHFKVSLLCCLPILTVLLLGGCGGGGGSNPPPDNLLEVPYYSQGKFNWCLYTSTSMILKFYGKDDCELWKIAAAVGPSPINPNTDQGDGLDPTNDLQPGAESARGLRFEQYIQDQGLTFEKQQFTYKPNAWNYIEQQIDLGRPVLLGTNGHAVVVVGYDANRIYINDPNGQLIRGVTGEQYLDPNKDLLAKQLDYGEFKDWAGGCTCYVITNGTESSEKASLHFVSGFFNSSDWYEREQYYLANNPSDIVYLEPGLSVGTIPFSALTYCWRCLSSTSLVQGVVEN